MKHKMINLSKICKKKILVQLQILKHIHTHKQYCEMCIVNCNINKV